MPLQMKFIAYCLQILTNEIIPAAKGSGRKKISVSANCRTKQTQIKNTTIVCAYSRIIKSFLMINIPKGE